MVGSLRRLLVNLRQVNVLTVYHEFIQVLAECELVKLPCPSSNWKCLVLKMGLTRSELPGIAWLLRCSPTLETLELSFGHENFFQGLCIGSHFGPYFEDWKREMFFPGLAYHLKIIHIIGFTGNSYEVELEFLLKNALVLEKIVFCSLKEHQSGKMFSEMILSFPRGSASAAIYSFEKYYD